MDALTSPGYVVLGLNWLFEVKPAKASVDGHEDDSDGDSHANQDADEALMHED